jgi:hypothetical protein
VSEDQDALFDVPELAEPEPAAMGRTEAGLYRSVQAGREAGTLVAEDAGLIGAALVAARGLDAAERGGRGKPGPQPYAIAALLTPYREALHALRLPAAIEPAKTNGDPRPAAASPADLSSLLGDAFGPG